eukprot:gnl/TRDRNA2_/TRDRNA2_173437_c0_seq3.p1 gnl/TRDRNA2_/TRDRNA2_173437_c0~~gnl/TRDRNA2_/TRDRNA2_173437_c0_seq3.p1  ORF type:complete len:378 (-),score=89.75 gnl/TRDRNA2_/TRDRNA2_173437_c0_seq3:204-1337(-)
MDSSAFRQQMLASENALKKRISIFEEQHQTMEAELVLAEEAREEDGRIAEAKMVSLECSFEEVERHRQELRTEALTARKQARIAEEASCLQLSELKAETRAACEQTRMVGMLKACLSEQQVGMLKAETGAASEQTRMVQDLRQRCRDLDEHRESLLEEVGTSRARGLQVRLEREELRHRLSECEELMLGLAEKARTANGQAKLAEEATSRLTSELQRERIAFSMQFQTGIDSVLAIMDSVERDGSSDQTQREQIVAKAKAAGVDTEHVIYRIRKSRAQARLVAAVRRRDVGEMEEASAEAEALDIDPSLIAACRLRARRLRAEARLAAAEQRSDYIAMEAACKEAKAAGVDRSRIAQVSQKARQLRAEAERRAGWRN